MLSAKLHGAHGVDKGKGIMPASVPAAVTTPTTPVAILPALIPTITATPAVTTPAPPTAVAPVPATTAEQAHKLQLLLRLPDCY